MDFAAVFYGWRERHAMKRELDALGCEGRGALARDMSITEGDLIRIATARTGAGAELPRLMRVLSLDPVGIAREPGGVMRELQLVCCGCNETRRCRRDLDCGAARTTFTSYCLNAETLVALGASVRAASHAAGES